ncbi:molybdopterin converting factor subunit 1 [Caldichromatium japonicum]|uniref:Molybdopterin synthase sulfur carrier subunit n=1 Tax=Caldichromatium japonicum TaxID=2699430 RepID=A0A6G7VFQ8_9GAMM|nr:molybdopterin converting factor subunit 1 [Caldichromatium japonicum]QIK38879.1 molybdopterin converting factor subunit 1 [Caldichromatium japonicum]
MIWVRYFASLRERLGVSEEHLDWYEELGTVSALRASLCGRGGVWADSLAPDQQVLCAVNQELSPPGAQVRDGDEVAFFPPVTGG